MTKNYYNPTIVYMQNFSFLGAIELEIWAFKEKKDGRQIGARGPIMTKNYYNQTVVYIQNFSFLCTIEPEIWAFKEKKDGCQIWARGPPI